VADPQPPERTPADGHYFDAAPGVASKPKQVSLALPERTIPLTTDTGVFSGDQVDAGTRLLLLDGPALPAATTHVLDLGCGYGPIAIALALRAPAATVWAVDTNARAVALCAANAAANGADGVRALVVPADDPCAGIPPDVRFDTIWSNPPIRIGKAAAHDLLRRALTRLRPGGTAHLVVQKHLGADSLHRWLEAEGWPTERRTSRAGYRLLDVLAPDPTSEEPST